MSSAELIVVPDFATADAKVRAGTDSASLVVLHGQTETEALAAARAGIAAGRGPLPARPFAFPGRSVVVLPTYNEKENLEAIARDILAYLKTDLLVVDDGSPDGTGAIADRIAASDPRVHVMHRKGKQGLGTAYIAGFRWAHEHGYTHVFEMDADFSHPPWDLPRLMAAAAAADLVLGSRYVRGGSTIGWDFKRRMLSRSANLYARTILGTGVRDMTGGFRCFAVAKLMQLDLAAVAAQGYAFQIEMTYRMKLLGAKIVEVPIHFVDRRLGASKMDAKIAREALLLVPKLRKKVRVERPSP